MTRLLLGFLVLVLSGAPAAAVVCDLLLCTEPRPSEPSCHEHGDTGNGARMVAGAEGCDHVAVAAPSLTAAPRHTDDRLAAATLPIAAIEAAAPVCSAVRATRLHGPPCPSRTPLHLPLRI